MMPGRDPTRRFGDRVEDYVRWRPTYPRQVPDILRSAGLLCKGAVVADLGTGTGLLARAFLDAGCEVVGVEPNEEMRREGERALSNDPRFRMVAGRAERTGLADGSIDLVVAGQSFHWFDPGSARREALRICRGRPAAALIWNLRVHDASPLMAGYDALARRWSDEGDRVTRQKVPASNFRTFFGSDRRGLRILPNLQVLDREGLRGRFLSSSYSPARHDPEGARVAREIDVLFDENQRDGKVTLIYETHVHFGELVEPTGATSREVP